MPAVPIDTLTRLFSNRPVKSFRAEALDTGEYEVVVEFAAEPEPANAAGQLHAAKLELHSVKMERDAANVMAEGYNAVIVGLIRSIRRLAEDNPELLQIAKNAATRIGFDETSTRPEVKS